MGPISLGEKGLEPRKLKDVVSAEDYEKLVAGMLKADDIKELYDKYIIKDIPFEKWVRSMINEMVVPR